MTKKVWRAPKIWRTDAGLNDVALVASLVMKRTIISKSQGYGIGGERWDKRPRSTQHRPGENCRNILTTRVFPRFRVILFYTADDA